MGKITKVGDGDDRARVGDEKLSKPDKYVIMDNGTKVLEQIQC